MGEQKLVSHPSLNIFAVSRSYRNAISKKYESLVILEASHRVPHFLGCAFASGMIIILADIFEVFFRYTRDTYTKPFTPK